MHFPARYSSSCTTGKPGCIVVLIDQSGMMSSPELVRGEVPAMSVAAAWANGLLYDCVLRCLKGDHIRRRLDVAVIGYGRKVSSAFGGPLSGRNFVPIDELYENPMRIETRVEKEVTAAGEILEYELERPIWLEPKGFGPRPLCETFRLVRKLVQDWTVAHMNSFPPIIVNICGGLPTDGDPRREAAQLREISTDDGNVLLYNWLLDSGDCFEFPVLLDNLPLIAAGKVFFDISSQIPHEGLSMLSHLGLDLQAGARLLFINASVDLMEQAVTTMPFYHTE